jgi:uncharacterized NAD(P)/FAD-binding protein YdhS
LKQTFDKLKKMCNSDFENEYEKKLLFYQDVVSLHKLKLNQDLVSKYKEIDFTKQEWREHYQNIYDKVEQKNQFKEIWQQLSEKIPNTIERILSGDTITFTDLQDAFYFKHAQNEVQPLSQKGAISVLEESIKDNKAKAQKLITDIGADKHSCIFCLAIFRHFCVRLLSVLLILLTAFAQRFNSVYNDLS